MVIVSALVFRRVSLHRSPCRRATVLMAAVSIPSYSSRLLTTGRCPSVLEEPAASLIAQLQVCDTLSAVHSVLLYRGVSPFRTAVTAFDSRARFRGSLRLCSIRGVYRPRQGECIVHASS
jgi:hypothetical protein